MEARRLLLEPECPGPEDPRMAGLVSALVTLAGARWGILKIRQDGWNRECRYVSGNPSGASHDLMIEEGPGFHASLEVDVATVAGEEIIAQAAFLLEQEMSIRRLGRQVALLKGALDGTSAAVFLFDRVGNIVYANPPADAMLTQQTQEGLVVVEGGHSPMPLMGLLCQWVDDAVASQAGSVARNEVVTLSDGTIFACEILRIATGDDGEPGVVVLLQPVTAAPDIRLEILAKKFGLGPREHDVLKHLANGLQTAEIASAMCISPHTVRDHIKKLYRKTGTCSRGGLLNLLSRGGSGTLTRTAG